MHEFSLAQNIIEIVEETARKNKVGQVSGIELEIGTLSGVEIPALDMALESLREGSVIARAKITKIIIQAEAECNQCGHRYMPDDYLAPCPKCAAWGARIISGKELRVKSITAE